MHEMNAYSKAAQIVQEAFSSLRTVLSFNGGAFEHTRYVIFVSENVKGITGFTQFTIVIRYKKAMAGTVRSGIRKGAAFGAFAGWNFFLSFLIYAVGFIAGILLKHNENNRFYLSDVLIVRFLDTFL